MSDDNQKLLSDLTKENTKLKKELYEFNEGISELVEEITELSNLNSNLAQSEEIHKEKVNFIINLVKLNYVKLIVFFKIKSLDEELLATNNSLYESNRLLKNAQNEITTNLISLDKIRDLEAEIKLKDEKIYHFESSSSDNSVDSNGNCNVSTENHFVIGTNNFRESINKQSKCPTPNCDGSGNLKTGGNKHWCLSSCPKRSNETVTRNSIRDTLSQQEVKKIVDLEQTIQELQLQILDYKNKIVFAVTIINILARSNNLIFVFLILEFIKCY